MNEKRMMHLLLSLGYDEWSREEQEWFCFTLAALIHAYKEGAHGAEAVTVANAFLAEYGRESLPSGLVPSF